MTRYPRLLLAEAGCKIIEKRMGFVEQMNRVVDDMFGMDLRIHYYPAVLTEEAITRQTLLDDLGRVEGSEIRSRRALLGPQRDRLEVVVTFLAMLELIKRRIVEATQLEIFGDIEVMSTGEWDEQDDAQLEFIE